MFIGFYEVKDINEVSQVEIVEIWDRRVLFERGDSRLIRVYYWFEKRLLVSIVSYIF